MRQRLTGLVLLNFLVRYDLSGQTASLYTAGSACLRRVCIFYASLGWFKRKCSLDLL